MPDEKSSDDYVGAMAKQMAAKLEQAQSPSRAIPAANATPAMATAVAKAFQGRLGAGDVIDLTQMPSGVDAAAADAKPVTKSDDGAAKE